jgi:hypothetical protein
MSGGRLASPERTASHPKVTIPTGLPIVYPTKTANVTGLPSGEREEGHDGKAHPGMQHHQQAFDRRQRLPDGDLGQSPCLATFRHVAPAVLGWVGDHPIQDCLKAIVAHPSAGRRQQAEHHAGDGGVNPGGVHRQPDHRPHQEVERSPADTEQPHPAHAGDAERAQGERSPGELAAVADRNHQNGSDVIDDRERQHEDPQAVRDAPPQEGQAADDERGVGRHDRAPAVLAFSTQLEHQVQGRGNEHPTQGGRDRERRHA